MYRNDNSGAEMLGYSRIDEHEWLCQVMCYQCASTTPRRGCLLP